jgi:hypothetical protein
VSSDVVARISNSNKTSVEIEKDQKELAHVKRMYFRNSGDFFAVKPPQNDEIDILGYFYKQPSTKKLDQEEVKSDENNSRSKGTSMKLAASLKQNYRLLIRRLDDAGTFKYHAIIHINVLHLQAVMPLFRPDTQEMISNYHSVYYDLFKKLT